MCTHTSIQTYACSGKHIKIEMIDRAMHYIRTFDSLEVKKEKEQSARKEKRQREGTDRLSKSNPLKFVCS